jgi:hypothetical protein
MKYKVPNTYHPKRFRYSRMRIQGRFPVDSAAKSRGCRLVRRPQRRFNQMGSQQFALVQIERLLTSRTQLLALTRLKSIKINYLPQSSALLHIAFSQSALASASFAWHQNAHPHSQCNSAQPYQVLRVNQPRTTLPHFQLVQKLRTDQWHYQPRTLSTSYIGPVIFLLWKLWIERCERLPTIAADRKYGRSSDGDIVVFLAEWTWIWEISKQNGSDVLAPLCFTSFVRLTQWLWWSAFTPCPIKNIETSNGNWLCE